MSDIINVIENKYKEFTPEVPFEYTFLDSEVDKLYNNDAKLMQVSQLFSIICLIISIIGIFGFIVFIISRKTKEIGIRRVYGANSVNILIQLCQNMISLIFIAMIISWTISWLLLKKWFQSFAYHIDIDLGIFISCPIIMVFFTFLIISWQTYKGSILNPIASLKYE